MAKSHESRLKDRRTREDNRRNREENGWTFRLSATSILHGEDVNARVKRLDMYNEARMKLLPTDAQEAVSEGIKFLQKIQEDNPDLSDDDILDRVSNNRRLLPSADAFICATFLDPRVFLTREEAEEWAQRNRTQYDELEYGAWVVSLDDNQSDIEASDRMDYFFACLNADSQQARRLKPFRPRSVIDVEGRAVSEDAAPTSRDSETASSEERESGRLSLV